MSQTKILSEKIFLKEDLFQIKDFEIETKNGIKRTHRNVRRTPTVAVFPIGEHNELYLISQYRYLFKKNILEAVGGFIDSGEDPLEAAKRELKEETGISGNNWTKIGLFEIGVSAISGENHTFVVRDLDIGEAEMEEEEEIQVVKIPLKEAVQKVVNGEFIDFVDIAGILLIDKLIKENKL